jgi:hypothetical protein
MVAQAPPKPDLDAATKAYAMRVSSIAIADGLDAVAKWAEHDFVNNPELPLMDPREVAERICSTLRRTAEFHRNQAKEY